MVPMRPNRLSHGLGDFRKEWVRKVRKEQPDGEGARGHHAAGNPVRLVVELLGPLQNPLSGGRDDFAMLAGAR